MAAPRIRTRFFVAVEGQSEQSFVRWLQQLSDNKELHIHLHCEVLDGGGFKTMLYKARKSLEKGKRKGPYKHCFLLLDSDRSDQDGWSPETLKKEAGGLITVCFQKPNLEGLFLRMIKGNETSFVHAGDAETKLKQEWPNYLKPTDARSLGKQFVLDDLLRMAKFDGEIGCLLQIIGLMK